MTSAQLRRAGLSADAIAHRVRRRRLHRVHYRVFAVGRPPRTPLERAAAAVLACGPHAALSHTSALALWGFVSRWPPRFDVTLLRGDARPKGIVVHRSRALRRQDIRTQLGIRVTSSARTILDCAPGLGARRRTRIINDALHTPFLTVAQLADVRARFANHPGAKLLDPFLDESTGLTRSELEDDFRAFCARFDLPRPICNTVVAGHLVDALFSSARVIVELDSWEFHRDRTAFESDRDRDADTLAAGLQTIRVTWRRLTDAPAAEAQRLRRILAIASRRRAG